MPELVPTATVYQGTPTSVILNIDAAYPISADTQVLAEFRETLLGPIAGTLSTANGTITADAAANALTLRFEYAWLRVLALESKAEAVKLKTTLVIDTPGLDSSARFDVLLYRSYTRGAL